MSYLTGNEKDPFVFDFETVKDLGRELAATYASAEPFPHVMIDDFLPKEVIDYCIAAFPAVERELTADDLSFDRDQERYKRTVQPDYLEPKYRQLFYTFNSRPFIRIIENITGISGLIPDPYFIGGGLHETRTGGHLSMHADFNHHKPMDLERRINLLIYLNPDWKLEYGGQLELWRTDMSERVQEIAPVANRCVLFTTTGESMHGHPQPVAHPRGEPRRSIALYYYTSTWDNLRMGRTTQFHRRPGTGDKTDWKVKSEEIMTEYLPPFMSRPLIKFRRKVAAKVRD